ncbi:MAG: flagellar hook capping FlgD N-terminal domain-containing protein [Pseudomonadota bacterium]
MDITNNTANSTLSPAVTAATDESQAAAVLSSDFETFLQMLTAQAEYQDPLEPIDSSEYAAQLAQFSMVEQQVLSNELLTDLSNQLGAGNLAQMAGWIGLEARTTAPVSFQDDPITILPKTDPGADEAVLVVSASDGSVVARRQIAVGSDPFEWDGTDSTATPVPPGNYSFSVESRSLGTVISTNPAESYAQVTEARSAGSETVLVLQGGSEVGSEEITALREPT